MPRSRRSVDIAYHSASHIPSAWYLALANGKPPTAGIALAPATPNRAAGHRSRPSNKENLVNLDDCRHGASSSHEHINDIGQLVQRLTVAMPHQDHSHTRFSSPPRI